MFILVSVLSYAAEYFVPIHECYCIFKLFKIECHNEAARHKKSLFSTARAHREKEVQPMEKLRLQPPPLPQLALNNMLKPQLLLRLQPLQPALRSTLKLLVSVHYDDNFLIRCDTEFVPNLITNSALVAAPGSASAASTEKFPAPSSAEEHVEAPVPGPAPAPAPAQAPAPAPAAAPAALAPAPAPAPSSASAPYRN